MKRTWFLAGLGLALLCSIAWSSGGLGGQSPPDLPTVLPEPSTVVPREPAGPPAPPLPRPILPDLGPQKPAPKEGPAAVEPPPKPSRAEEAEIPETVTPATPPELPPVKPMGSGTPGIVSIPDAGPPLESPSTPASKVPAPAAPGKQVPAVSIEWIGPPVARVGVGIPYQIVVRNVSSTTVEAARVEARLPRGTEVKDSSPEAVVGDEVHSWNIGTLAPRQEKRIELTLVPKTTGQFTCQASVTLTGSTVLNLKVHEPKLAVKLEAPPRVTVGDPALIRATVHNPGDATAKGVKLRALLTEGLKHVRGQEVEFALGNIPPREGRKVVILCDASADGVQACGVVAHSAQGLTAKDKVAFEVMAPRLTLGVAAPRLRYLGRKAAIRIQVTNNGNAPAQGVSISERVPSGFRMIECDGGGGYDYATKTVSWYLGTLEPGQSREMVLHLLATDAGEHKHRIQVTAARGLEVQGEASTRVEGLSALLMELTDLDDPVEVRTETSYEVRVTNTGTKTETNLQLSCSIPPEMEMLGARGAGGVRFKVAGREVVFDPLPALAPRADATYRIRVRGAKPGDIRFQARIQADGLTAPVLKEESTHVYGDEGDPGSRPAKAKN